MGWVTNMAFLGDWGKGRVKEKEGWGRERRKTIAKDETRLGVAVRRPYANHKIRGGHSEGKKDGRSSGPVTKQIKKTPRLLVKVRKRVSRKGETGWNM